jgi:hypothetical protein
LTSATVQRLISPGGEALRFGLPDPRQVRVEGEGGEAPHFGSFQPTAELGLVVPLTDSAGFDLAVTKILLFDHPGNLIFAAGVRGGKIAPIPVQRVAESQAG